MRVNIFSQAQSNTSQSHNNMNLQFASEALRNNIAIVQAAISSNGNVLPVVSDAMRNDRQIVQAALGNSRYRRSEIDC